MTSKFTGVVGKSFAGDRGKAVSYMGQARLLVQQLINRIKTPPLNGVGQMYGFRQMDDGSTIYAMVQMLGPVPLVRTWIESPKISITNPEIPIQFLLSMESGLLYIPRDADQGTLYPQSSQRALGGRLLDKMLSPTRFMHRDYSQTSFDSFSAVPRYFYFWGSPIAAAPFIVPGKLKLFLQARLVGKEWNEAREKKNKYVDSVREFLLSQLRYNDYLFAAQSKSRTLTLLTESPGHYYFIWFDSGAVKARRLKPNDTLAAYAITEAMLKLPQGSSERQRLEAYLFTDVIFDGDWFNLGTYDTVLGETIAYGWKPNWSGDRISIVTHVRFVSAGESLVKPIRTQQATATITTNQSFDPSRAISDTNAPLRYSLAIEKDVEWVLEDGLNIFWPAYTLSGATSYRWYGKGSSENYSSIPEPTVVPLYCFYTHDDRIYTAEYLYRPETTDDPFDFGTWLDENFSGLANESGSAYHEFTRNFDWGETAVRLTGSERPASYASHTSDHQTISFGGTRTNKQYYDCSFSISGPIWTSAPQCVMEHMGIGLPSLQTYWMDDRPNGLCNLGGDRHCSIVSEAYNYDYYVKNGTNSYRNTTVLVIPWGNSEACYSVNMVEEQILSTTFHRTGEGIYSNYQESSGIRNWRSFGINDYGSFLSSEVIEPDEGNQNTITQTVSRHYVDRFGVVELEGTVRSGEALIYYPDGLDLLFYPPIGWDWFDGWFLSITSVEGLRFSQEFPSQNNSPKNKITSNFGAAWKFHAGVRQLFCGWQ